MTILILYGRLTDHERWWSWLFFLFWEYFLEEMCTALRGLPRTFKDIYCSKSRTLSRQKYIVTTKTNADIQERARGQHGARHVRLQGLPLGWVFDTALHWSERGQRLGVSTTHLQGRTLNCLANSLLCCSTSLRVYALPWSCPATCRVKIGLNVNFYV